MLPGLAELRTKRRESNGLAGSSSSTHRGVIATTGLGTNGILAERRSSALHASASLAGVLSSESQRRLNRLFPNLEVRLQGFYTGVVNNHQRLQEIVKGSGNVASSPTSGLDNPRWALVARHPSSWSALLAEYWGVCE